MVGPLFKKGSTEDIADYRPTSLLPAISKIYDKVHPCLNKNILLNDCHLGFREVE